MNGFTKPTEAEVGQLIRLLTVTADMLRSCSLIVRNDRARALCREKVRESEALLAKLKPDRAGVSPQPAPSPVPAAVGPDAGRGTA